ncbi:acyl-CoA dehydrogenase [Virgisporangium aliadipatigenens]|uniref:Acyl-CoA dehydrogenase n=1 Tax=Virgisporangium aliadipatigenens TaxID=741659 RepID=A0A8J4DRW1_9ACTN|nr:acyl-CoA dehydrogenase [Virgisporangium aliadipatigenens]
MRDNAGLTERDLTPAPASVDAVREAGLFAITVPREYGGHGANLPTLVRVAVELGQGCPSTAWVFSLSSAAKLMTGAVQTGRARDAYFADPHCVVCASGVIGGHGETVPGGLSLTGKWRMASGCEVATWAFLVTPIVRDGAPAGGAGVLVPVADLTVERSWDAAGLGGTGSHTLVADGVFVEDAFVALPPPGATMPQPPARLTIGAVLAHLAPMLGAAKGAHQVVEELLRGDKAPFQTTYRRMADSPLARLWFAEATRLVDAAVERSIRVAELLDRTGDVPPMPSLDRSTLRMELVTAAQECRAALGKLLDLHGASGFQHANPLQRFWRDVEVGTRYAGLNPFITAEDHSRLLLTDEPPVSMAL